MFKLFIVNEQDQDRIYQALKKHDFVSLGVEDWDAVWVAMMSFPAQGVVSPVLQRAFALEQDRIYLNLALKIGDRDGDGWIAIKGYLEQVVRKSRPMFCAGLTHLINRSYEEYKSTNSELSLMVCWEAVFMGSTVVGGISREIIEKIGLDRESESDLRYLVLSNIWNDDFINRSSPKFWESLYKELPSNPRLASYLMSTEIEMGRGLKALGLIEFMTEPKSDSQRFRLRSKVRRCFEKCRFRKKGSLPEELRNLPQWALDFIKKVVTDIPDRGDFSKWFLKRS